ncbi:hypothetical protein G7046_g4161 [Stylonectria norvegica]|nr:hypothetical protein G7046_g4161 [Stylonectria norvegica]
MRKVFRKQRNPITRPPQPPPPPPPNPILDPILAGQEEPGPRGPSEGVCPLDMPRRKKGWTKDLFYSRREQQRRCPLAMNPLSGARRNLGNNGQNIASSRMDAGSHRGTIKVKDQHGVWQLSSAIIVAKAMVPGITEECLRRYGLQGQLKAMDLGMKGRRMTPLGSGKLELAGTISLLLQPKNDTAPQSITFEVWRGETRGRYDLYLDPKTGLVFLEPEVLQQQIQGVSRQPAQNIAIANAGQFGVPQALNPNMPMPGLADASPSITTPMPSSLFNNPMVNQTNPLATLGHIDVPPSTNMGVHNNTTTVGDVLDDNIIPGLVFPPGAFGGMEMAVLINNNNNPAAGADTFHEVSNGTFPGFLDARFIQDDNQLVTAQDFTNTFIPEAQTMHHNHTLHGPDGICQACIDLAFGPA